MSLRLAPAILVTGVLLAGCGGGDEGPQAVTSAPPAITASPIDVAHVTALSKFRSCSGHDFSPGARGHGEPGAESARSMKHYLQTDVPLTPADTVPVFAPIDGVVDIQEETTPIGKQVYISRDGWSVRIFHVDPSVSSGHTVTAGQQIGSIAPAAAEAMLGGERGPDGSVPLYEFDIAVTSQDNRQYVSMLDLMSPEVAQAWAARGFAPATATISKEARDAAPCALGPDGERFARQDVDPSDWVEAR